MAITWRSEQRNVRDLKPNPNNPRVITGKKYEDLKKSIGKFGLAEPIVIQPDGTVIGGHARIKVLEEQGIETVDCYVPDRELTEEEYKELLVRLNKNVAGDWDFESLANQFDMNELMEWGFEQKELDRFFVEPEDKDDDTPDVAETDIKPGDIFQLGQHRLMCGDSTNPDDVGKLMKGEVAGMIFTDPPYNVNYSGQGKETSNTIENDNMTEQAFREFLTKAFENMKTVTAPSAALYCCYASLISKEFWDTITAAGWEVRNQIVWVKPVASMGWGDYRWKHEPMLYAHKYNESTQFFGDRTQYTVWERELSDDELLKWIKGQIKREEDGNSTVWRFKRESNYKHPTQKPVDLVVKAILNSSVRGSIVLDLFAGSGSTMIACEKTERVFYGMELDPKYVQVIVDRYKLFTGLEPKKL